MAQPSLGDAGGSQPHSQWTPPPQRRPSLEGLEAILTSTRTSDDGGFGFFQSQDSLPQRQQPASFTFGVGNSAAAPICVPRATQMASMGALSSRDQQDLPSHPFLWHHRWGELTEWQPSDANQVQQPAGQAQAPQENREQVEGLMAAFRSVGGTWESGPETPDGARKALFLQPRFPPRISVSSSTPNSPAGSRNSTPRHSLQDSPRQSIRGDTPRTSDTALSDCGETAFRSLQGGSYAPFATSSGMACTAARGPRFSSLDSGTSSRNSSTTDDNSRLQGLSQLHLMAFSSLPSMSAMTMPGRVRPDGTNDQMPLPSSKRPPSLMNSLQHRVVTSEAAKQNLRTSSDRALLVVKDEHGEGDDDLGNLARSRSVPAGFLSFNEALEAKQLPSQQPWSSPPMPLSRHRESITSAEDSGMASDSPMAQDEAWEDEEEHSEQGPGKSSKAKAKPRRRYAEHMERLAFLEAHAAKLSKIGTDIESEISKVQKDVDRLRGREMELLAIERVFAFERRALQAKLEAKGKQAA